MEITDEILLKHAHSLQNAFIRYYKRYEKINGNANNLIWLDNSEEDFIIIMARSKQRDKITQYIKETTKI